MRMGVCDLRHGSMRMGYGIPDMWVWNLGVSDLESENGGSLS